MSFMGLFAPLSSSSSPSELAYEDIDLATCVAFFGERGFDAGFFVAAGFRPLTGVGALRAGLAARPV